MSAPLGNQFWKLRSKHGREKLFESPDALWEAACEYFESIQNSPYKKVEAKTVNIGDYQSRVELVELPVMKPFTMHGLCRYLGCNTVYFYQFEKNLKQDDPKHQDFSNIITRIREIIYEQKFSGAAAGFFNANIIARDLGLADKKEVDKKTTKVKFTDAAG